MKLRIELALVALCAAGCSLVIGDISLPARQGSDLPPLPARDMAVTTDAGPDGRVPSDMGADDGAVGLDLAPPDVGPGDMAPPPPDAAIPDALLPDAAPPPTVDIGTLAGVWHLYGAVADDLDFVFEVQLVVNAVGAARVLAPDGTPLNDPAPLRPDPEDPLLVQLHLFPVARLVRGTIDPVSGIGVLAGSDPPTFVLAVRPGDARSVIPAPSLFSQSWMAVRPGYAELGVLSQVADFYTEGDRHSTREEPLEAQVFVREDTDPVRHQLTPAEGTPPEFDRVVTAVGGFGAIGLVRREGVGVGLTVVWTTQDSNLAAPPVQRAFCAGVAPGVMGTVEVRAGDAQFGADGSLVFAEGQAQVVRLSGIYDVQGLQPLLGTERGIAVVSPNERAYVLMPATVSPPAVTWGLGACVRVEEMP